MSVKMNSTEFYSKPQQKKINVIHGTKILMSEDLDNSEFQRMKKLVSNDLVPFYYLIT